MKNNTPEQDEKFYLIQTGSSFHICISFMDKYMAYQKSTSKNKEETIHRFIENGLFRENVFTLQPDCVKIRTYDNYDHILESHPEYLI